MQHWVTAGSYRFYMTSRCRVVGGHPWQSCEQYEAQRGPEFVCKCPGCGVYVVKGDGERRERVMSKSPRFFIKKRTADSSGTTQTLWSGLQLLML